MTDSQRVLDGIKLVDELDDTELNALVDYIRFSYKQRQRQRNATAKASIQVGTRVLFGGNRKPQYLSGMTGVVEEIRQTRVVVMLDDGPVGKFRTGRVITQPGGLTIIHTEKDN